jgi:hypothetical protein
MKIRRKELYAKVWTIPIQRLATELESSCTSIHKTCQAHRIPKPGRGHWRRLETGQSIQATPLPDPEKDYEIQLPRRGGSLGNAKPTAAVGVPVDATATSRSASAGPLEEVCVDEALSPDPIAVLRRLAGSDRRERFLCALQNEAGLRDSETATAARAWIERARDAAVILNLVEDVMSACSRGVTRTAKG